MAIIMENNSLQNLPRYEDQEILYFSPSQNE